MVEIFGSVFEDYKDIRRVRRRVVLSCGKPLGDLTLSVPNDPEAIRLDGAESFSILKIEETEQPVIEKRIKIAKGLLIVFPVALLAAIAVTLAVVLSK